MEEFNPDNFLQKTSKQSTEFNPDEFLSKIGSKKENEQMTSQKIQPIESAARGFAQGATLGFADELSGGTEALWEKAKGNPTEFGNLYKKLRDESRSNFKKAEIANPGYYTAGEIGGGIATAAVPLGATATLSKAAITGARFGAINSLGQSEADNLADAIEDTALGAGLGATGGVIGKGVERTIPAIKSIPKAISNRATKEATETASQVLSKESGSIPIENPGVFKEAARSFQNRVNSYRDPKLDPSFSEFADIARKNGINPDILPESVKFGPDSSASRAQRSIAEGRFGEESLKRFNAALAQVRGAYDSKINNFSKGIPTDEITAGKILRDSYDDGVSKFFDQMDFTHNSIIEQAPGLKITEKSLDKINSSLNGVEKFAIGRIERGVTDTQRKQGQQLLNAVAAIRAGNGSYKQTVEALRDIGEAAFQSKNSLADVPVDTQKMRKIYNDLNESLIDTVRSNLGDDIAESLIANNKAMSEFFGDSSLVSKVIGDKSVSPEAAFKSLILSGDSKKIEALKKIIPEERWEYFKGAVLENLAKRDPEGNFTFKQLHNSMRSKRSTLSSIFTPEELSENAGLIRLGDRFGSPVLSSSGTGASISFNDLTKGVANFTTDAIALKNANKSYQKAINPTSNKVTQKQIRDVSPILKDAPVKTTSNLLSAPFNRNDSMSSSSNSGNQKSAQSETPLKGPEKWIADGASKLLQHDHQGLLSNPEIIEKLKGSKKGRDLLIRASDLKPNTKAMDNVLKEIRMGYQQEAF